MVKFTAYFKKLKSDKVEIKGIEKPLESMILGAF